MPAKHPRLTITLRPELHARLRRLSELTQNSQSALIAQLLDGAEETLDRVIRLLEAANQATGELRGRLSQDMHHAQERIERQLGLGLEDLSGLVDQAEKAAIGEQPGEAPGAAGASAGREPTPLSNRGVRSLTNATEKIARRPGPARAEPLKVGSTPRPVIRGGKS